MSSDAPVTIGIDLGTQSVRVVLAEEDGAVVGSASAPFSSIRSDEVRHEQDPEAWWAAVGEVARHVTAGLGGRQVQGLAICSTSGTTLLADADGRPLTPAIMYNDGRASEEARIAQEAGEEVWDSLGYRISSSYALPRLLWVLRNGHGEGASRMMHQADFIASRLAGELVETDWSHALKTGWDLVNWRWPEEVMERLCFVHLESLGASVSGRVSSTGGGARSRLWSQLRADVLGVPVVVPRSSEGSVGMAILGRAGDGSVAEAASRMSQTKWEFEPHSADGRLAENFERLMSAFVERGYIPEELAERARMEP